MNDELTHLCSSSEFVEGLLKDYLRDPRSVPPEWQALFAGTMDSRQGVEQPRVRPSFAQRSIFHPPLGSHNGHVDEVRLTAERMQDRVDQLIRSYRVRGHLIAKLDPLGFTRPEPPELSLAYYGLSEDDLDRPFSTTSIGGPAMQTLRDIVDRLRNTYCNYIGVQFMHIDEIDVRRWLQERMEETENRVALSRAEQLRILTRLTDAVIFEAFVRKKYVGAKTFSLEGAESLIPLLDLAIEKSAAQGLEEIVMAMAHRGRLNVLANVLGKRPLQIFHEFEDPHPEKQRGKGDVKYHLGFSSDWYATNGRKVHLSLCFNPSHLEFVNPVACGRIRSKQDRVGDYQRRHGMALLIHGDAGFSGEGIVQETLNFSQLEGFRTGGTLHVIVNNQLGFTTSPEEGRSTSYASDVGKMLQSPILHVNGEHPEAVAQVVNLALDFRQKFQRDVIIDMYCYRRWGHNEGDEPSFTQPVMYRAIKQRKRVRDGYLEHLLEMEGVTREEADRIAQERHEHLQEEFEEARQGSQEFTPGPPSLTGVWEGFLGGPEPDEEPETGIEQARLTTLIERMTDLPDGFHLNPKLQRYFERRRQMASGQAPVDWSTAEALAFASLATEGHRVRVSGQDTARGTFSQRHSVLYDVEDGTPYSIFSRLDEQQASVEILNSPLSEAGVLGFEYGYSLDYPEALVAWEAQFGDFWNAAQVIVDQFLASAEDKWRRLSGLVLLLPHGFEGQGPEHSSARLERFLNLAADHNIQVVQPSTPAQYFHCLRRQVTRRWRKPLIVLTPKSLLRHRRVVSDLQDMSEGRFRRVLGDEGTGAKRVSKILLCSGKVYYELLEAREEHKRHDVAIVRLEQFYPLPEQHLQDVLKPYPARAPVVWVQEEPENMGAWYYLKVCSGDQWFGRPLSAVTRPESASPATGSSAAHKREQAELIQRAFHHDQQPNTRS